MNRYLKILFVLLCLAMVQSALAQEAYYLKQEVSHKTVREGTASDKSTYIEELYLNDDYLVLLSKGRMIVIKNAAKEILIVDTDNQTYLKTAVPYDPMNVLTEVSALRFLEDEKAKGTLKQGGSARQISGSSCPEYTLTLETRYPQKITLWAAAEFALTGEMKNNLKQFRTIEHYNCGDEILNALSDLNGLVLEYETIVQRRGETRVSKAVCLEFSEREIPRELLAVGGTFTLKEKLTYTDLTNAALGQKPKPYNSEELAVLRVIERFRDGYRRRDVDYVDEWVKELFAEDAFILGTDAPWPDTWEWRGGHTAAREMFARDWSRWGNVKIFDDEIFVNVDGDAAWVAAFAVVSQHRDDDDRSRQRSLARIGDYVKEEGWTSRRAAYEIIADASSVLVQYERGFNFAAPMRTEFGLIKRGGKWLLKMVHFSHPARGFRSFRLFNAKPGLLEYR